MLRTIYKQGFDVRVAGVSNILVNGPLEYSHGHRCYSLLICPISSRRFEFKPL
jgi:hypothetical protein